MTTVMYFIHIVGALSMGFYLILPFVVGKIGTLSPTAQEGSVSVVRSLNRYAQIGLVIQLLTGGYMISKGDYTVVWMVVVIVLFLAIAAIGGIMGKPLRLAMEAIRSNQQTGAYTAKIRTLSVLLAVFLLVITFLMVNTDII